MSEPRRFGDGEIGARPEWCGGALVRGPGDLLRGLERNGVVFTRVAKADAGKLEGRVRCEALAHTQVIDEQPEDPREAPRRREVRLGLCDSCSRLEAYVRRTLKETAGRR